MNDTIKPPAAFDPVPPTAPASILDLPRPLFPPPPQPPQPPLPRPAPRQTLPVTDVEYPKPPQPSFAAPPQPAPPPLPVGIAPEQPVAPNPLAGTPAPRPSAMSGLLWDLLRPNRAKVAVLAGVASLAAGAFGLNLLVPTETTVSSQPVKLKIPVEIQKPAATTEGPKPALPSGGTPIAADAPKAVAVGEPSEPAKLPLLKDEPRIAEEPRRATDPPPPGSPGGFPELPPLTDPNVRPASGTGTAVPPVPKPAPNPKPAAVTPTIPGLPDLPPIGPGPATPAAPPAGPVTPTFGAGEPAVPGLPGLPASAEPKPPALPAAAPTMPEPPPALPSGGLPALPAMPGETPKPKPPMPEPGLPALPGGLPAVAPEPAKPTPAEAKPPLPVLPDVGALPLPTDPVPPVTKPTPAVKEEPPKLPGLPPPLPTPVDVKPQPAEPKPPAEKTPFGDPLPPTLPAAPEMKPAPLPVPPPLEPVVGAGNIAPAPVPSPKPAPVAAPTARPAAAPTTPPAPLAEAKTGYDVDLHRTRSGDTYATVSQAYYGGPQYAAALQSFNRNLPITRVAEVQVPPVHIIRTYAESRPAAAAGGNRFTPPRPAGDEITWGEPGSALGGQPEYTLFTVPRTGLTLRDVATTFYGSDRNWSKLNNPLNPKFGPDQELPVGTKLQVPTGNITFR